MKSNGVDTVHLSSVLRGESYRYEELVERMNPGDLIAIYSDGVTEARGQDGDEFGQNRLAEILVRMREKEAAEIVHAVTEELSDWCASEGPEDDVTLVVRDARKAEVQFCNRRRA